MSEFVKVSLLDDFEIPVVTHNAIKEQLVKIGKSHSVKRTKNVQDLPLTERLKLIESEVYKVLGRYKGFVKVIDNAIDLERYIDKAISVGYLALDTETNNSLDPLTCKIMGLCLYIPNTKPVYVPINHCKPNTDILLENQVSESDVIRILGKLSDDNCKIIYHNGKFDIRVIYNTLGMYLPIWWDTMLAAQVLDENDRAGLKPQFKKYIDPTIGTYNIEKLFAGIPYAWVSPEIFALYSAIDAYDTYKLQQHQESLFTAPGMENNFKLFRDIEVPVTLIVAKMEDAGLDIDMEFVGKLNAKYHKGMDESMERLNEALKPYEKKIRTYQLNGKLDSPLNFNSSAQLQILLYDVIKVEPLEDYGRSTDKTTLKLLNIPFTKALLDYRHYTKLISAFTEALPKLRSPRDGKIHASFNQMGKEDNNVVTGRFSSTNPNLQQIPSHEKVMRLMFKASPGYVIIGGDYSQQEPRLLTHMCGDPKLIETYNNKKDLYATIASFIFKKDYWECMEKWEDGTPNPQGKEVRSMSKKIVLGIMYGMGAKLMASNLNVSVERCKEILEEFYQMFPTVKAFTQGNEQMARDLGYVEDYIGRRRHLPDINLPEIDVEAEQIVPIEDVFVDDLPKVINVIDRAESKKWVDIYNNDKAPSFKKKPIFKDKAKALGLRVIDNGAFISKATTQCTNARIQGSAASLTKKAMVEIYKDKELMDLGFRLLVPVHDELLGECPVENADKVEKLLVDAMIRAGKPECSVNMKVDTYCVKHWYSDEVANGIRDAYLQMIKGNESKGIEPMSEQSAYAKLCGKYVELSDETVLKMCKGEFDHLNDTL
jgi:DNA polymerase I-like protein with 3'-5' exonuclease and polymerase domains